MAIVKIVPQLGCVSQDLEALVSLSGKFEKHGSLSLRYVKQVSGTRKDHRLEKYKSNILISEVPTLWNLRTGPMKRLKDNSDVPEARLGTLTKIYTGSKRKTKLHSTRPQKNGYCPLRQQKSWRKKSLWWIPELVCIWSASETLTLLSWRPWGHRGVRRRWWRPTARCKQEKKRQKQRCTSKNWTYSWRLCFLKKLPKFSLSLGKLCEDHGYTYHWTNGQKPHLTKKTKRTDCNISNYVPFVVRGLSATSSTMPTPTSSSSSSSQDSVFDISRYNENPVPERSGSTSEELRGNPVHEPTETENKNINAGLEGWQSDLLHELTDWIQDFREKLVDVVLQSHVETLRLRLKTLPVLLMNYQWSREQKWHWVRFSIVSTRTFRRTQIATSAWRQITRASCRRRAGTVVPRAENFGDLINADHEFPVKKVNRVTIIDMPWWCKTWQRSGYNPTHAKQKLPRRPRRAWWSSWSRQGKTKSHLHWQFQVLWGIILESLCVNTTQIRNKMGLQKEQCAEWKKGHLQYCCNQVWTKNGGRIPWNVIAICETFKISCLLGRHHTTGGSECPVTDQWYRLEQWANITLFLRRTYRDYMVRKSCQVYSSVMYCVRGESGKETLWSQTLNNWRRWTHQESAPEGLMQRKW